MVDVSASVNLPLHHKVQKFFYGTGSTGWSRKKGRKMVVCVCVCVCVCVIAVLVQCCCVLNCCSQVLHVVFQSFFVHIFAVQYFF